MSDALAVLARLPHGAVALVVGVVGLAAATAFVVAHRVARQEVTRQMHRVEELVVEVRKIVASLRQL